jgi:thiol-disulfide isomerase/thioredoxin
MLVYILNFPEPESEPESQTISQESEVESEDPSESEDNEEPQESNQELETEDDSQTVVTQGSGVYADYSPEAVAQSEGDVVIFFAASWCPSCRALDNSIVQSQSDIPSDVTNLKADYDSETELRRTYGVTTQHTLVQVDQEGNEVAQWSGGSTLASIIGNIE